MEPAHQPLQTGQVKEFNGARPRALSQRPEYTSAHNKGAGRHAWLRLTPAYSVTLVHELLADAAPERRVLDPFGGTGTTALCAASRGHEAVSCDINPFLLWLATAKFAHYSAEDILEARDWGVTISERSNQCELLPPPPMRNIERWWSPEDLEYLRRLKTGIKTADCGAQARDLLLVAFCRVIIERAKLTRRHQSLSFRSKGPAQFGLPLANNPFTNALTTILETAQTNPATVAVARDCDARELACIDSDSIDTVVTSPPYPNRMTSIRELRPYMYWLGFLENPSDAGQLDWKAIGGTWGAATHNLRKWELPSNFYMPHMVQAAAGRIAAVAHSEERGDNATVMSKYILRYFADLWFHTSALYRVVRPGGNMYFVVGNSSFYGQLVETEKALAEMFIRIGFRDVRTRALRKRSSKSELFEFVVEARKV
jgi:DNA modification methylase